MNFFTSLHRIDKRDPSFPFSGLRKARCPASGAPALEDGLTRLVEYPDFPCVGAKSALAQDNLAVVSARAIDNDADDARIHRRLVEWSRAAREKAEGFRSLAVVFVGPTHLDERQFEARLWERLGALRALDRRGGHPHAAGFSPDPAAPDFALSFGGEAYFAVGLHPKASRPARRLAFPAIVFNLHSQFAALRAEGRYEKMRKVILARDEALAGSVNPMVARHGEVSEARQYSGRAVGEDWVCPMAAAGGPA
jgi:FPC/CPF motif-containing protein YcgG